MVNGDTNNRHSGEESTWAVNTVWGLTGSFTNTRTENQNSELKEAEKIQLKRFTEERTIRSAHSSVVSVWRETENEALPPPSSCRLRLFIISVSSLWIQPVLSSPLLCTNDTVPPRDLMAGSPPPTALPCSLWDRLELSFSSHRHTGSYGGSEGSISTKTHTVQSKRETLIAIVRKQRTLMCLNRNRHLLVASLRPDCLVCVPRKSSRRSEETKEQTHNWNRSGLCSKGTLSKIPLKVNYTQTQICAYVSVMTAGQFSVCGEFTV